MKALAPLVAAALIALLAVGIASVLPRAPASLKSFSTQQELNEYVRQSQGTGMFGLYGGSLETTLMRTAADAGAPAAASAGPAKSFSTTNIQVAGVDEPDIVKTDGDFLYVVSGTSVFIVQATPADNARITSQIDLKEGIAELFVNSDRLIVFGNGGSFYPLPEPLPAGAAVAPSFLPPSPMPGFVRVYDTSDKAHPILINEVSLEGWYVDSRMIGDHVYVVFTSPVRYVGGNVMLPALTVDGATASGFREVYYFDNPEASYQFTTVLSVNVRGSSQEPVTKTYLLGSANTLFVSPANLYIAIQKTVSPLVYGERLIREAYLPSLPPAVAQSILDARAAAPSEAGKMVATSDIVTDYLETLTPEQQAALYESVSEKSTPIYEDIARETQKTVIHKIALASGAIDYQSKGEVPGQPLNQFSMDEYQGTFRIATTTAEWWNDGQPKNHVYVLDGQMTVVGKLEDLAPGERIYSARFLGDKAYLVTFKRVDPLFVIGLSDPANPTVLGQLKIPGFSDYLHPYDETHLIGIGKETEEDVGGQFARIKGLKLALFDVSDPANPRQLHRVEIGDRGTDSEALYEHKAFLFDREKQLLVLPVSLMEIKKLQAGDQWAYGEPTFQGAYVYRLTPAAGFELLGRITHYGDNARKGGWFDGTAHVTRSLYIDDVLYTISASAIKANRLFGLEELAAVSLPVQPPVVYGVPGSPPSTIQQGFIADTGTTGPGSPAVLY